MWHDDDAIGAALDARVDRRVEVGQSELEEGLLHGHVEQVGQRRTEPDMGLVGLRGAAAVGDDDDGVAPARAFGEVVGANVVHSANLTAMSVPAHLEPGDDAPREFTSPAGLAHLDGVGVGPHPRPWPDDPRLDPQLLAEGDRRNVVDRYRYWRVAAIVADLDERRHDFHVAVENWDHDLNIGTVVRNANAFGAGAVHIVGRKRWNRRGAMVTDRYQHLHHHRDTASLVKWANEAGLVVVGIDNLPGARPLETVALPRRSMLVFGQEGPGLSTQARESAEMVCSIAQFGSTRSINAGVASGIAMHTWVCQHATLDGCDGTE